MNTILHDSESRGHTNFGWLDSRHTFSFGQYYDPERIHFGALRVINDDWVDGGQGFDTHPHANMEIVTIPLQGKIEHKDSTGRHKIIASGEVQIMSAGSGIRHSEYNASQTDKLNFLQIWVIPDEKDIPPRYDQKAFDFQNNRNKLINVIAPDDAEALWINQKSWFSLGHIDAGEQTEYILNNPNSGVYLFMISGEMEVGDEYLRTRDGIGIADIESKSIIMNPVTDCKILLMEVPMQP